MKGNSEIAKAKKKVLIVDDERAILTVLGIKLKV